MAYHHYYQPPPRIETVIPFAVRLNDAFHKMPEHLLRICTLTTRLGADTSYLSRDALIRRLMEKYGSDSANKEVYLVIYRYGIISMNWERTE